MVASHTEMTRTIAHSTMDGTQLEMRRVMENNLFNREELDGEVCQHMKPEHLIATSRSMVLIVAGPVVLIMHDQYLEHRNIG